MVLSQIARVRKLGNRSNWRVHTPRIIRIVDAFVIVWSVYGAYLVRFGFEPDFVASGQEVNYVWLSAVLCTLWWFMLGAWNSRQPRILGSGPDEYKRVAAASLWLFGLIAIFSYVFRIDTARGYVGIALPVGLAGLMLGRWLVRQHLSVDRQRGSSMSRLLILGSTSAIEHLATTLGRVPHAGYEPIAAYVPSTNVSMEPDQVSGLPVLGYAPDAEAVLRAIETCRADAVAITSGVQLHPLTMRYLGWELAARNIGVIMAPALTDISGPRIHTQQVAGLPLIHVTTPTLEAGQRVAKRLFDVVFSSILLILAIPLMIAISVIVKISDGGPILFRQERIGIEGQPFKMLKFRSMVTNAEAMKAQIAHQNEGSGVLFKLKKDPRVTPAGKILRKFSLDELPQLLNIVAGSMSLVGPRPPLPDEVANYEHEVRRRLMVKPGLTGLWQVSGRSNLSWQDSVRLDLYYVENWSLAGDIVIILRTIRAVFRSTGAY